MVLVSNKTASGAEIVAGALKDHERALIVGETTFGQSVVQSVIPLQYGSALAPPTSKFILPSGRFFQRDEDSAAISEPQTRADVRTDKGRAMYAGEGIKPDELVKPRELSSLKRMIDPIADDPQVLRAIEAVPRAAALAASPGNR